MLHIEQAKVQDFHIIQVKEADVSHLSNMFHIEQVKVTNISKWTS